MWAHIGREKMAAYSVGAHVGRQHNKIHQHRSVCEILWQEYGVLACKKNVGMFSQYHKEKRKLPLLWLAALLVGMLQAQDGRVLQLGSYTRANSLTETCNLCLQRIQYLWYWNPCCGQLTLVKIRYPLKMWLYDQTSLERLIEMQTKEY